MRCPNCGKEIANDSVFCEYCGTKLNIEPNTPMWLKFMNVIGLSLLAIALFVNVYFFIENIPYVFPYEDYIDWMLVRDLLAMAVIIICCAITLYQAAKIKYDECLAISKMKRLLWIRIVCCIACTFLLMSACGDLDSYVIPQLCIMILPTLAGLICLIIRASRLQPSSAHNEN